MSLSYGIPDLPEFLFPFLLHRKPSPDAADPQWRPLTDSAFCILVTVSYQAAGRTHAPKYQPQATGRRQSDAGRLTPDRVTRIAPAVRPHGYAA